MSSRLLLYCSQPNELLVLCVLQGVPSPATPEVLQVKCSDDCKGPAPCILAVGSNVTGATADGMDLAIGLRCGRSNAYIWHCGEPCGATGLSPQFF